MWVEELKTGKCKFIERYTDPMTGKYRRVSIVLEKNTAQARKQAQSVLTDKIEKALCPSKPKSLTLSDLVEKYREEQEKMIKRSTYRRNYFACEAIKEMLGADTNLAALNAGYIRKSLLATGKKPGTLNEHLKRLKALLRWGYRNDYIDDISYLQKLERFADKPHREKIEDKFLEQEEVVALIDEMQVKEWKELTEFLVLSGLRFGEAAALNRSDIDLKARLIHVTKNYDSVNDLVTTPKTSTSIRDIYIQEELYQLCRRLIAQSISGTVISLNSQNLLFPGENGEHISFFTYNKYLKENALHTLGRPITPHTLRHTHASLMMENGMDKDSIARRLGHNNSRITEEIYLHVTKRMAERENEQIKSICLLK